MWVTITLAGLLVLLALVLCVPLDATLRLDIHRRLKFQLRLVWFFGLVDKEVRKGEKKPKKVKAKPKPGKAGFKTIIDILRTRGLTKQFSRLLFRLIRCFKIRDLSADLRVGLGNPADTGILFAVIGPPFFFLEAAFPQRVSVQPAFADRAILEGSLNGVVRLSPVKLVIALLGFIFSFSTLRVTKTLVRSKWKRKKQAPILR